MNTDGILDLLLKANRLKTVPRTGWAQRGVAAPESVAAHSHGVALIALYLLDVVDEVCDRATVLAMAVLHDLPEAITGDMPRGASRLLPPGAKAEAECRAMDELVAGLAAGPAWRAWQDQYMAADTPEAHLVKDADKLDLLVQALVYELTTGNRTLGNYWDSVPDEAFHFAASRELAGALRELRRLP